MCAEYSDDKAAADSLVERVEAAYAHTAAYLVLRCIRAYLVRHKAVLIFYEGSRVTCTAPTEEQAYTTLRDVQCVRVSMDRAVVSNVFWRGHCGLVPPLDLKRLSAKVAAVSQRRFPSLRAKFDESTRSVLRITEQKLQVDVFVSGKFTAKGSGFALEPLELLAPLLMDFAPPSQEASVQLGQVETDSSLLKRTDMQT